MVGGEGWGWSCSWDLTPLLSMQLEQRGRLQKSVAKEVSRQGTLVSDWRESPGLVGRWPNWGLRLWGLCCGT